MLSLSVLALTKATLPVFKNEAPAYPSPWGSTALFPYILSHLAAHSAPQESPLEASCMWKAGLAGAQRQAWMVLVDTGEITEPPRAQHLS